MTINDLLLLRYGQGLTYQTLIQDSVIMEHLPMAYLPKFVVTGEPGKEDVFLDPTAHVTTPDTGVERVVYLYLNSKGELKNNPELSMVQINRRYKGFLARLRVPSNRRTPENLVLDYVIDLQKILLTVDTNIGTSNTEISESTRITFQNLNRNEYPNKNWYEPLFDFDQSRTVLFEQFFQ